MTLLLIVFALGGCAVRNAIERGHELVARREYRAAIREYEHALKLDPESDDAQKSLAQVKPYAVAEAVEATQREIDRDDYEAAMGHVHWTERYDQAAAETSAAAVAAAMRSKSDALLAARQMRDAYDLAARTRKLLPKAAHLEPMLIKLRAHFFQESDQLLAAKRYKEAFVPLAVVEKYDNVASELEIRRQAIRGAWRDEVVTSAQANRDAGKHGAAAVLYARAFEIAQRREDVAAMRELTSALRKQGTFSIDLDYTGDATRAATVARLVEGKIANINGVVFPQGDDVTLLVTLDTPPGTCNQTHTTSRAAQDYVAGTRHVPNPEHGQLTAALSEAGREHDRLATALDHNNRSLEDLARRSHRCELSVLIPASRAQADAQAKVNRIAARIEAQLDLIAEMERRRDEAGLARARRNLSRMRSREQQAMSELSRAQSTHESAVRRCGQLSSELERERGESARMTQAMSNASADMQRLVARLSGTPSTIEEQIIDTFQYEVRHWTRACSGAGDLTLDRAWAEQERHHYDAQASTSDDSNDAHSPYGVLADPLAFPMDDGDLGVQRDADIASRSATQVRATVRSYYVFMTERALEWRSSQPDDAADIMVAIFLAAPAQLDGPSKTAFAGFLEARYGLSSMVTLTK